MTLHPKFITDETGRKLEAVLPIAEYEELLEDLAAIAERKDEPTVPWETVKQELIADGLLHDWIKAKSRKRTQKIAYPDYPQNSVENWPTCLNPYPKGCKKLTGSEHSYRVRIGDYLVIYTVFDDKLIIQVIKIGHRKDIYR